MEKRPFRRRDDTKKWCEIYRTSGHDLKECKTFLDRKKMPPPAAQVAQEPHRGEHHRANPPGDDVQMGEINVIFEGSMFITSKTQGKKFEREISWAQRIEPKRMMRWSDMDIPFGPDDDLEIELSDRNLPFVVKLLIGRHNVDKTLIDNGASLNLIMRKTFTEMCLNLKDMTPAHDMFHHQTHRPGGVLWNREQQVQGGTNVRGGQLRHQVQLHPREASPPKVYGDHSHCLCYVEDA
jgi:hypothetical protein